MSSYSEVIGLIVEINRIITAQAQRIELTASSTSQLMDLVTSSIDGAPSKYVSDVKSGIADTQAAFRKALVALGEAQVAIQTVSS